MSDIWSAAYTANKDDVPLYMWRKHAGAPDRAKPRPVLFLVHGSSFSGPSGFDLTVSGHGDYSLMDAFARVCEQIVASPGRWALMHELRGAAEPPLAELLARLSPADLVLIEGYKREAHPKIEAHRTETGRPLIAPGDTTIRAVASNSAPGGLTVPVLDLDDTSGIADFILKEVGL